VLLICDLKIAETKENIKRLQTCWMML